MNAGSMTEPGIGIVAIDANVLDGDGTERDALVSRFRALVVAGEVSVLVAPGVRAELARPQTPDAVRDALPPQVAPLPPLTHARKLDRIRVRAILRGDAPSGKHEADALHLSEAAEAGCTHFLTQDRRILRKRGDLRSVLPGLEIMTLARFIEALDAPDEEPPW